MAKIEIDENEYAELKRVGEIAQLIGKNPDAVRKLQEAVEIAAPDRAGPEIRIRKEVNDRLSGIETKFDEFLAKQQEREEKAEAENAKRRLERQWAEGRRIARAAGYTDEGLEQLETYMEKEGVASHKVAMAAFERENPPPEPVVTGNARFDFFNLPKDDIALDTLLKGNDEAFLNQAIPAALKAARGG